MIYLDNNATTKVLPEVRDAMVRYLTEEFGNPSSKYYELASNAKKAVEKSREIVATMFDCQTDEVIFTSGATESNNMIIKGVADIFGKGHIITTKIEHPSVLRTVEYLETKGYDVTYLDVDQYGRVSPEQLNNEIKENTILVSIMWVNNEIGSINPIDELAKICKTKNVYFHVDATQAVGKMNVFLPEGVNFVSFSAHKLYGPKGVGAAIVRKDQDGVPVRITPLLHGGEQEDGYRGGTLAVHNIVGLGKACEIAMRELAHNISLLKEKERFLINLLNEKLGDMLVFNSPNSNKVPGTINFQIKGVKNVIFLNKIASHIAASSGSACSITHPSETLSAIGLTENQIQSSIRFSLSPYEDISELEDIL